MAWGGSSWGQSRPGNSPGWQQTPTPMNPQQQGMQQALGVATGWNGPNLMQNDLNADRLAAQLGYAGANYGLGVQQLQQNIGLDRQRLGVNQADLGIDLASINRQIGVNGQLQGLANQLFGIDIQGLGLNQQGINSKLATQNRGFDRQRYQEMSDKTARGSVGSVMHKKNNADILANQHDAWDSFWRDTAGNNLQQEQVGVRRQESDINFGENKAKLEDRKKTIANEAAKLGIDGKQLEANLQQGLARLGLDQLITANDIFDGMLSNDIERQAILQQIFREAMGMSSFFENNTMGAPSTGTSRSVVGQSGFNGGLARGGAGGGGGGSW